MINESDNADAASEGDEPADDKGDDVDRGPGGRNDMHRKPRGQDVTEDDENTGCGERNQRERYKGIGAETALPEGPAIGWKTVGTAKALHKGSDNAGSSGKADQNPEDQGTDRLWIVVRSREVALKDGSHVRRENPIEEKGQLETERSCVRKEADEGRRDDKRGEERDHGGIGRRLGNIETVVRHNAKQRAVEYGGDTEESSHVGHGPEYSMEARRIRPSTD